MDNLKDNQRNILDLPDEILLEIYKKLRTIDVFHSLLDVNQRFRRLAFDSLYVHDLEMTSMMNIHILYDQTPSFDAQVLRRICEQALPQINDRVYKLTVDQITMKPVLYAANYPNLYSLSLCHFQDTVLHQYLKDDLMLRNLLLNKITHLNIDIKKKFPSWTLIASKILESVLSLCKNLTVLNFGDMFLPRNCGIPLSELFFRTKPISSTLIRLKIKVKSFLDIRYFFDGRFNSLSILIIQVSTAHQDPDPQPIEDIPQLKIFSLTIPCRTRLYDTFIVPLLRRMRNLRALRLYLRVVRNDSTYVDGIQLYDQFLHRMTHLTRFTFDIKTKVVNENVRIKLPSNEDIQRTFRERRYPEVFSYVKTYRFHLQGKCHMYSVPYDFEYFYDLDNSFQGGMFHNVQQLTMVDRICVTQTLLRRVFQKFPFLKYLSINNPHAINYEQYPSIKHTFPSLTFLDLERAHLDYAKLFLSKRKVHLPSLANLCIEYGTMEKITNNFTEDVIKFNFDNLQSLDVCRCLMPRKFHRYFSFLSLSQ